MKKKVLFVTPVLSYPIFNGPTLRIDTSIKALSKICDLYVFSIKRMNEIGGVNADNYFANNSNGIIYLEQTIYLEKSYKVINKINNKINIIPFFPKFFTKISNYILARSISIYVDKQKFDVVWFAFGGVSYGLMKMFKHIKPNIPIICDTDSVWSRFILRELPFVDDNIKYKKVKMSGMLKELEEKEGVEYCDITTAVSDIDAEYFLSISTTPNKIKIFSNVIDLENYPTEFAKPKDFKTPSIYLAGSFFVKNSSMEIAARWFILNVLTIIRKEFPNIHLYIIGNGSDVYLSDIVDINITITGRVESVFQYLCNSDVSIVPLFFESGTRFKILEAGACNIPVVSTTLGAEGIPVTNEKDILIADTVEDFAFAVIRVLKNKNFAETIAYNLKQLVYNKYSVDYLSIQGKDILDSIDNVKHIKTSND